MSDWSQQGKLTKLTSNSYMKTVVLLYLMTHIYINKVKRIPGCLSQDTVFNQETQSQGQHSFCLAGV